MRALHCCGCLSLGLDWGEEVASAPSVVVSLLVLRIVARTVGALPGSFASAGPCAPFATLRRSPRGRPSLRVNDPLARYLCQGTQKFGGSLRLGRHRCGI